MDRKEERIVRVGRVMRLGGGEGCHGDDGRVVRMGVVGGRWVVLVG